VPSPTDEPDLTTPAGLRAAGLLPDSTAALPLLPVESREQLVYLLTQACELEQGVLCEYLFALYSLKRDPQDGLGGQQLAQVARWGRTLSEVAVQEMLHLTLATNLLTAVGAVPHLHRPNFPIAASGTRRTSGSRWCRSVRRRCATSCTWSAPTASTWRTPKPSRPYASAAR
jgi:hypothetical protein